MEAPVHETWQSLDGTAWPGRNAKADNVQGGSMTTMARSVVSIVFAVILIFVGWIAGSAQTSAPAFELVVDAPGGETTIQCVKGCSLSWVERGLNANATPMATFTYRCTAPRCSSGRVGGWLTQ
jgi:hypothetical protein